MRFPVQVTFLLLLFLSGSALAQENVQNSRVLLPITILEAFPVPGAFGSQWTTDLWVRNDADAPVFMGPFRRMHVGNLCAKSCARRRRMEASVGGQS